LRVEAYIIARRYTYGLLPVAPYRIGLGSGCNAPGIEGAHMPEQGPASLGDARVAELDWNVAIYCANEAEQLREAIETVAAALRQYRALITVIVNGSRDGSLEVARTAVRDGWPVEVFQIKAGDKSNAINQFIHALRSPARAYGAVDGYVSVGPCSFSAMQARLQADPHILAVTGNAGTGRTMHLAAPETLLTGGRLHGQLHALRPDFLDRMAARSIRLPVGLYRGDGLLGSMAAHNLAPLTEQWDSARLPGVVEATFAFQSLSPLKARSLQRLFHRKVRQMRGVIENAAIKEVIYKKGYEGLPGSADDMLRQHVAAHGVPRVAAVDRVFQRLALRQLARAVQPDPADLLAHRAS